MNAPPQNESRLRPNFGAELLNRIASLVTVGDICSPVLHTFEASTLASEAIGAWEEACLDRVPSDPGSYICLVHRDDRNQGWLDFTDLVNPPKDATVESVMTKAEVGSLVSAEMSLLAGMELFTPTSPLCFLVLKGNLIAGVFSHGDLFSLPFNACLLMSLFAIEQKMLEITKTNSKLAVEKLGDTGKRIQKNIEKEYPVMKRIDKTRILERITFRNLMNILRACKKTNEHFDLFRKPWLRETTRIRKDGTWITEQSSRAEQIVELRNALAHPREPWRVCKLLSKDDIGQFFRWRSELERALSDFLVIGKKLEDE